jgi:hypothetical protein
MKRERERDNKIGGRMWIFVGSRSLTWRYLEEAGNFLSASTK